MTFAIKPFNIQNIDTMKVVVLAFAFVPILVMGQDSPTVCLESGACYVGSWLKSNQGKNYGSFQGLSAISLIISITFEKFT